MKLSATHAIETAYDVITNWGEDTGARMMCVRNLFIIKLAEELKISGKSAQNLFLLMRKHGYVKDVKFNENAEVYVFFTEKFHKFNNSVENITRRASQEIAQTTKLGTIVDGYEVSELQVLKSNAGYYIGRLTLEGEPFSRESDYYRTRESADSALKAFLESEEANKQSEDFVQQMNTARAEIEVSTWKLSHES
jgi:hypothetical protein